jgi:hypothetical protein
MANTTFSMLDANGKLLLMEPDVIGKHSRHLRSEGSVGFVERFSWGNRAGVHAHGRSRNRRGGSQPV